MAGSGRALVCYLSFFTQLNTSLALALPPSPLQPCDGKAPGAFWLYDMSVDEAQQHDVASQHPDIVSTMLGIMHAQYDKNWPN